MYVGSYMYMYSQVFLFKTNTHTHRAMTIGKKKNYVEKKQNETFFF